MEELLKVDHFAHLVLLRPRSMTDPHLDSHAHLGCRRNTSIYAQSSGNVRREKMEDVQTFHWCPGVAVIRL
jgi:hypothetical protein